MLYFSHKFGDEYGLKAIYNGRFSFISGVPKTELEDLFYKIINNDFQKDGSNSSYNAIREEFEHKKLYLLCRTGLYLNGFRLFARFFWAVFGIKSFAEYYYTLRTLFFSVMYPIHEMLVNSESEKTKSKEIIKHADRELIKIWMQLPYMRIFILFSLLFWLIGRIFSSSFTVINIDYVNGKLVEKNYAERGIVNQTGNVGKGAYSFWARFFENLRIEKWFRVNLKKDWMWMLLKFITEYKNWNKAIEIENKIRTLFNISTVSKKLNLSFENYMSEILGFVSEWVKYDSAVQIYIVISAFQKAIRNDFSQPPYGGLSEDQKFRKFVNFFYLHGN